jgi:hypothetical protein
MSQEVFVFTSSTKRKLLILGLTGILLVVLGIIILAFGGHGHEGDVGHEAADHAFHWSQRLYADLWINNVYFVGLAIIGVFFFAVQYAAQAGWSSSLIRIPLAFGNWLPYAFGLILVVFYFSNFSSHWHLFHWLDQSLYNETLADGSPNPHYDGIIAGKEAYLNLPFYFIRMFGIFLAWIAFFFIMRNINFSEDIEGGIGHYRKLIKFSAIFIIFFALSSAVASWDWIMSIDTHWFSTMFGWYVFASWFAAGLAAITLVVILLRENGYLPMIKADHIHDLGKYVFAFSIFWTYIWFSQYLLIYYANIPEESVYFIERLKSDFYTPFFFLNIILNFFFPFLVLMTRDAKRHGVFLKIVCVVVLFGHWLDFYLMVTPGTLQENGGFGFLEIGTIFLYTAAFLYVVLNGLTKSALVPKNHPMLQESMHHHV